ncbi:4957_t:CDS:1, partial [Scutellospora calospora]
KELQEQRTDKLQQLGDELSSNFLNQINSISDTKKLKQLKEEIINDKVLTPLHKLMLNGKINEKIIEEPIHQPDDNVNNDDIKKSFLEEIESITIYNVENYIDQSNLKERIESSELPRGDKIDVQTALNNKIGKINNDLFTYFD